MKNLHRIQIDLDIEAESHDEAVSKVAKWFCTGKGIPRAARIPDCHDSLVLEENEEVCPTCTPELLKRGDTTYEQYNQKRMASFALGCFDPDD